jgi:hypothetical protein
MENSPLERTYCNAGRTVLAAALTLAIFVGFPTTGIAQTSTNRAKSKGPRAVAILEFDSNKKVHLVPVTIMVNGEFYDASAYKATPIPMALEPETVYEGMLTGVSEGLFTISRAHEVLGNWVGEGKWAPKDEKPPEVKKPAAAPTEEGTDKPPVLRRPGSNNSKPASPTPTPAPPEPPKKEDANTITVGGKAESKPSVSSAPEETPDHPVLRRGKPEKADSDASADMKADSAWTVVTTISAVSDVKEESARSYHYAMNPDQESDLREKVQALAVKQFQDRAEDSSKPGASKTQKSRKASAAAQPKLQNVKFQAYDPSTSNQPIFVFEADAPLKDKFSGKEVPNHLLLVTREDIYGDLHVLFSNISDPTHMDLQPKWQFVDVVDAEGDGYGDLLFRRTYDSGRAFSVYRVIGNQLWPLFEGRR